MDELAVGDSVHVGNGQYSDVFLFTHSMPNSVHPFVVVHTGKAGFANAKITLTASHFIYANGNLTLAGSLRLGDVLELGDSSASPIYRIEHASFKGLFNPQTVHGDIVVDGIRASTYTTAVQSTTAHSLLAPLRAFYLSFGSFAWFSAIFNLGWREWLCF